MNPDYYKDRADDLREFEFRYGEIRFVADTWKETTEDILDKIDIKELERYLRKKKLEKINENK